MGLFSSLFSPAKQEDAFDDKQRADLRKFDILKYDGIRAQRVGRPDYAVRCFIEALKIQKDFETMKCLASAYCMLSRYEEAFGVLDEMVAAGQEPANTLLMRAGLFHALGRNTEALADCAGAVELEPDNHLAWFQLAKTERVLGKLAGSIEHLTTAIGLKEDFAEGYMLRADLYLFLKQGTDALPDVEKVVELIPDDEAACLLRGRIHELLGDVDAALADYLQALETNPFNEDACLLAGRLMMAQEKYEEAILLFDEAIEHNEQFAKACAERGRAKERKGDREGALADMKKALELSAADEGKTGDGGRHFDDLCRGNII